MNETTTTLTNKYDTKMLRIITDNIRGDNADIQLPVKAAKKLICAIGRVPVGGGVLDDTEMKELMNDVATGLNAEKTGDIVGTMLPDGTRIRAFVY